MKSSTKMCFAEVFSQATEKENEHFLRLSELPLLVSLFKRIVEQCLKPTLLFMFKFEKTF